MQPSAISKPIMPISKVEPERLLEAFQANIKLNDVFQRMKIIMDKFEHIHTDTTRSIYFQNEFENLTLKIEWIQKESLGGCTDCTGENVKSTFENSFIYTIHNRISKASLTLNAHQLHDLSHHDQFGELKVSVKDLAELIDLKV